MNEREGFLKALAENEDDATTRQIYADWLDENDEPEEADRMRAWPAAKAWMLAWVRSINYGHWEYDEEGDYLRDNDGNRVPAKKDNLGDPHTYADAIEIGHKLSQGDDAHFGSDAGADFFRSGVENYREFFKHWSVITGVAVPDDAIDEAAENYRIDCTC